MDPAILRRISELERQIQELQAFVRSFTSAAELSPEVVRTILAVTGGLSLSLTDLADVDISSPSSGQVLKYNGTLWANGTDNT